MKIVVLAAAVLGIFGCEKKDATDDGNQN